MSFTCNICKGIFEKELSDEEAEEQLKEEFPGWTTDQCDLICDDCYNELYEKSEGKEDGKI